MSGVTELEIGSEVVGSVCLNLTKDEVRDLPPVEIDVPPEIADGAGTDR